jgi:hypothetical protein
MANLVMSRKIKDLQGHPQLKIKLQKKGGKKIFPFQRFKTLKHNSIS